MESDAPVAKIVTQQMTEQAIALIQSATVIVINPNAPADLSLQAKAYLLKLFSA